MDESSRTEETPSPLSQLRDCCGAVEYGYLVDVWRSAVMATHHFLAETDRVAIESQGRARFRVPTLREPLAVVRSSFSVART